MLGSFQRCLVIVTLAVPAFTSRTSPGTETILLVKGGYGVGVNLISSSTQTSRRSSQKAPVDRTPAEKDEVGKLGNATKTALALAQQLQSVVKSEYTVMQEAEHTRVDDAHMREQVAKDQAQLQHVKEAEQAKVQLTAEVAMLQKELAAAKANTTQEHARAEAMKAKTQSLEHDIQLLSRAWRAAAQHQASLAKQYATSQPEPAKKPQVPVKKAEPAKMPQVPVKKAVPVQKPHAPVKKAAPAHSAQTLKAVTATKAVEEDSDDDDDTEAEEESVEEPQVPAKHAAATPAGHKVVAVAKEADNDEDDDSDDADSVDVDVDDSESGF